jgi:hypothetical protein
VISMPSNVAAALASASYRTAILINLPGTGFKVTDNHKPITYAGVTYSPGDQALLGASSVQRTTSLSSSSYQIKFAGADRTAYQEYVDDAHFGEEASVYLAFLDDEYELLSSTSVIKLYAGLVDTWQFDETKTKSDFTIKLTSHWAAFEVVTGRFTNTSSQEEYYPNDTIFQYSQQEKLPIKWGQ